MTSTRFWQVGGLFFGILFIGYLLFIVMRAEPSGMDAQLNNLQIENRQLKRYMHSLQQQAKIVNEQVIDLETLSTVQQQVIQELRLGNDVLQNKLYAMEKDIQRYKEAYTSSRK